MQRYEFMSEKCYLCIKIINFCTKRWLVNMNWDIMGAWFLFNVMVCVAAVSFAIFLNTKAGKKWKKNL